MGVTQSDSLDHTRQLRFSNRGPSSSVSEHFENIDHIAIKLQALEGSMWCILPLSRDSTGGAFKREGIFGREDQSSDDRWTLVCESSPKRIPRGGEVDTVRDVDVRWLLQTVLKVLSRSNW
jgi:hypothetical protein